jgi:hypothetical protein
VDFGSFIILFGMVGACCAFSANAISDRDALKPPALFAWVGSVYQAVLYGSIMLAGSPSRKSPLTPVILAFTMIYAAFAIAWLIDVLASGRKLRKSHSTETIDQAVPSV